MEKGLVRYKKTMDIATRKPVCWVHLQDTKDALTGILPAFVEAQQEAKAFSITVKTIKYHIQNGRLRWKREGRILYVSKEDIEAFYSHSHTDKSRTTTS